MCAGVAMGWTSPALPVLQREGNASAAWAASPTPPLSLSEEQGSWASALVPLGAVAGALPSGLLADAIGRKRALLTLAAPYALGWVFIVSAGQQVWMLYFGRFLTGLGTGATTVLTPLYCEEIAEVAIRGALGAYLDFMICVGILWIYVLGAYVPYFWYTLSGCVIPVVFLLTFCWMPESPVFLANKSRHEQARKALEWLRGGNDYDAQLEMDSMLASMKESPSISIRQSLSMFFSTNPIRSTTSRAVAIVLGLMLFQQLSGINAVIFYTVQIFNEAGSNLSGEASTIIVGVVQVIAVLCSSITVDHLGRRFLLLLSTVIMAFCLLCLSLYAVFSKGSDVDNLSIVLWIPLVALILYVVVFALGFGPLPWLLMAELLPVHAKGWGSAIAASFNWAVALLLTKQFPLMLRHAGQDVTYGILCFFCVLGAIFIAKCLPETKGKTKIEIEESIGGDKP
ncbi:hypothetical protein R5R35_012740 [Gryllus longicercus]|uniref:Major facilitator superfamily (MFS) profile domain-containing protein n=1 Tax=Gryllus longicercus TaxID=2509291 RepID=A0AAN9W7X8_9ORTH